MTSLDLWDDFVCKVRAIAPRASAYMVKDAIAPKVFVGFVLNTPDDRETLLRVFNAVNKFVGLAYRFNGSTIKMQIRGEAATMQYYKAKHEAATTRCNASVLRSSGGKAQLGQCAPCQGSQTQVELL